MRQRPAVLSLDKGIGIGRTFDFAPRFARHRLNRAVEPRRAAADNRDLRAALGNRDGIDIERNDNLVQWKYRLVGIGIGIGGAILILFSLRASVGLTVLAPRPEARPEAARDCRLPVPEEEGVCARSLLFLLGADLGVFGCSG